MSEDAPTGAPADSSTAYEKQYPAAPEASVELAKRLDRLEPMVDEFVARRQHQRRQRERRQKEREQRLCERLVGRVEQTAQETEAPEHTPQSDDR